MDLLPFDEVRRRLRVVGQSYLGIHLDPRHAGRRIAGPHRRLRPRLPRPPRRLAPAGWRACARRSRTAPCRRSRRTRSAARTSSPTATTAWRSRASGATDFIDAEVTRLETNYELPPGVDVAQLVHTEQQRVLLEESGLARARPDAVIEFSRPGGYRSCSSWSRRTATTWPARTGSLPARGGGRGGLVRRRLRARRRRAAARGAARDVAPTRPTPTCSCGSTSGAGRCA